MITVKTDATSMSTVGGSDQSFEQDGRQVANGRNYVDAGEADFFERDTIALKATSSNLQGDGTYSKEKREVLFRDPYADATYGNQVVTVRIYMDVHPSASAAQKLNARLRVAQLLASASLDAFWNTGQINF